MILHEGNGILLVSWVVSQTIGLYGRPVGFDGIAHHVADREVEGSTCYLVIHLGGVEPVLDYRYISIPIFSYGISWFGSIIVDARVFAAVSLHHVVTESSVAEVIEEHVEISLYDGLHVLAAVVKVAHAAPVFAGIVDAAEFIAVFFCPFLGFASVIVGADVGGFHLVSYALVGFHREIHPVGYIFAMVDNHVGDGSDAVGFKSLDEAAEFLFVSERAVVVGKPVEVVVPH